MVAWFGHRVLLRRALVNVAALVTIGAPAGFLGTPIAEGRQPSVSLWLTLLHHNDGESQLIDAGSGLEDFGGVARFASLVNQLKFLALQGSGTRGVILVSSGDNFLAGPEFNASLDKGVPFFDALAMDLIDYDAIAIGNHEFDFGPDILADFIIGFQGPPVPFLSANLDFSQEPSLQALVDTNRIAKSVIVVEANQRIGIVGATTPQLPFISSPRNTQVDPDVASAVQAEIDQLRAKGVNKIILISHLQSVQEDLALAPLLHGIDIMVAGGGDELLANSGDLLLPGDEGVIFGPYPLVVADADGNSIPVVTTSGNYRYVGRLVVGFDQIGRIVTIDQANSGPIRVAATGPGAVGPDFLVNAFVTQPVEAAVAALESNIIGVTEVPLNGLRSAVRTEETNEGNLIADALLFEAARLADNFGAPVPDVAIQNGGGIRNDTVIEPGDLSELDTFNVLPFANFVTVVPDIPPAQVKEILENAVSRVEFTDGRFAQVSGFTFVWDPNGTPQELDEDGNVTTPGTRVREVVLSDGQQIVSDGGVVAGAPALTIATIDFLAQGGDQYPYRGAEFVSLGVTYQQALVNYIREGLGGVVTAAQYPEGGEGRIRSEEGTSSNLTVRFATFNASLNRDNAGDLIANVGSFPFPSSDHRLVWVDVQVYE